MNIVASPAKMNIAKSGMIFQMNFSSASILVGLFEETAIAKIDKIRQFVVSATKTTALFRYTAKMPKARDHKRTC